MVISVNLLRTDDKMIKYQYLAEKYSKTHDAKSRFLCPLTPLKTTLLVGPFQFGRCYAENNFFPFFQMKLPKQQFYI